MSKIQRIRLTTQRCIDKQASEGFCNKWKIQGRNGKPSIWVKAGALDWSESYDHQSLGEVVYSQMAKDLGFGKEVLMYYPCVIDIIDVFNKQHSVLGCYSVEMNRADEEVITLDKLDIRPYEVDDDKETYENYIREISRVTGISESDFRRYLDIAILLDCLSLNTDRRPGNLSVIRNIETGKYRICPVFDSGQSFLLKDDLFMMADNGEWSDWLIYNNNISTKLFAKDINRFHENNLIQTSYVRTIEGNKKLRELSNCSFNNTMNTLKVLYEICGTGKDSNWKLEKQQEVRETRAENGSLDNPIIISERNFIANMIKARSNVILKGSLPEFVPASPSEYDRQAYKCFYNLFR